LIYTYLYIIKMRVLVNLAYRFEVYFSIITNVILLVASIFLWKSAYAGNVADVSGLGLQEMITYTIISFLLTALFSCNVQDTIYSKVRQGTVATDLYRPISLLGSYLADDLGSAISSLVNKALPLFIIASLLFDPPMPDSTLSFILFLPSSLLSYAILWLLSALVGLIAFWVMELGNLGIVKDAIIKILSGSIVPLWFFPDWMQRISAFLPFQYTFQTPIGIYIGFINPQDAFIAMLVQLVWVVVLLVALHFFWKVTKTKTLIQGG